MLVFTRGISNVGSVDWQRKEDRVIVSPLYNVFSVSDKLFKPHMRKWADEATKTAVWEVYWFIHVNTVAPFGIFRTKIRYRTGYEVMEEFGMK